MMPRYVVSSWRRLTDEDDDSVRVVTEASAEKAAVEWALQEVVDRVGGLTLSCWVRGPWGARRLEAKLCIEAQVDMPTSAIGEMNQ
jgi:hypothetical protein